MNKRVCLDPGHGMGNRTKGVHDSGAVAFGQKESQIALAWGLTVKAEFVADGIKVWMTRDDETDYTPVGTRDDRAEAARCDLFISLHCNSASSEKATGVEAFYRDEADKKLAQIVLDACLAATGLPSRGLKKEGGSQHPTLAVFSFDGPCTLLEIAFMSNPGDLAKILSRDVRIAFADHLSAGLKKAYG